VSRERVPPGQRVTSKLPRLDLGVVPKFNEVTWCLRVEGLVERPLELSYRETLALPRFSSVSDFHCVTGWSRLDNKWEGVSFKTIVDTVRPKPEAKFVTLESSDGYATSLPLSDLLDSDVLLAYALDGERLEAKHGGPLRMIIPDKYAYKSAKWIERIRFTAEKEIGYWEQRGYSDTADPWTEDRFS
jgi:DMSO/TMAO reductase YedYZ molybdopterin-dependent catalytic subunit